MTNELRQQVLAALEDLSETYPDWRFGQMIANLATIARGPENESVWDMEDDELLAAVRSQLELFRARRAQRSLMTNI